MRPHPTRVLAIAGATCTACASAHTPAAPCPGPAVATAGWRAESTAAFTLRLPASFGERRRDGIDSQVWTWAGKGATLSSDYGVYSSPHTPAPGDREDQACTAVLGADTVQVALFEREGEHQVHAWWATAPAPTPASGDQTRVPTLMLYGSAQDAAGRDTVLAAVLSARLRRRP